MQSHPSPGENWRLMMVTPFPGGELEVNDGGGITFFSGVASGKVLLLSI